jgi:hypothetical protein
MIDNNLNNLNDIIVDTIIKNVPTNIKPVDCIMETLGLGRESVYRRIRKKIPFSMEEITRLSLKLGFSIDELIHQSKEERFFFDLHSKKNHSSSNAYYTQFYEYNNYLKILINAEDSETLMVLNEIPPLIFVLSDTLFKFNYYNWRVTNSEDKTISFSELNISHELRAIQEETRANIQRVNNVSIIMSPSIFLSIIKKIQYFYQRKLLTSDELRLLKDEILFLINLGEKIAKYGYFKTDAKVDFYLSSTYINSNILFLKFDGTSETHFWIYQNNPLIIQNPEICTMQKEWFQSLKKQSTLVSLSSEILQATFFEKQREYVETYLVKNVDLLYSF